MSKRRRGKFLREETAESPSTLTNYLPAEPGGRRDESLSLGLGDELQEMMHNKRKKDIKKARSVRLEGG